MAKKLQPTILQRGKHFFTQNFNQQLKKEFEKIQDKKIMNVINYMKRMNNRMEL